MSTTEILPPPVERYTVLGWLRKNLFGSIQDAIITIGASILIVIILRPLISWIFVSAQWAVIAANIRLIMVGRYPIEQTWRIWTALCVLGLAVGLSWGIWIKGKRSENIVMFGFPFALALLPASLNTRIGWIAMGLIGLTGLFIGRRFQKQLYKIVPFFWFALIPGIAILIRGFSFLNFLPFVDTTYWGGFLLTIILSIVSLVVSFPLGVLLAIGRQSKSPLIHSFSLLYIELVRAVPLVTILFTAQVVLPLFLPQELTIDRLSRALVAITLFSAAYMAEIVRGGLQAIPRGQNEAAQAIGLNSVQIMQLIVLPQALRLVIPVIVAHTISMFRDTSLVIIVGLLDLLGIAKTILAQPVYLGTHVEVYVFIAALYWVFCYVMSYIGKRIEARTGVSTVKV